MRAKFWLNLLFVGCLLMLSHMSAHAAPTVLLMDTFDGEGAPGASVLNYASFPSSPSTLAHWTLTDGSIDLISQGGFGIVCAGGSGKCLDMDGTTDNAARMVSDLSFSLTPGNTYTLMFDLSGNQRVGGSDTMVVSLGVFTETFVRSSSDPFATITRTFTVSSPTSANLVFDHAGGDKFGLILDNVKLTVEAQTGPQPVPEPGTLTLLGVGLLGFLGYSWRRR